MTPLSGRRDRRVVQVQPRAGHLGFGELHAGAGLVALERGPVELLRRRDLPTGTVADAGIILLRLPQGRLRLRQLCLRTVKATW